MPGICRREEVDLIDISPNQLFSVSTPLIPFLEHNDANRVLMGSNMQRQATPTLNPEAPLVSTGEEEKAAQDSGQVIISDVSGIVTEADGRAVTVKTSDGNKTFNLYKFKRSNQSTCMTQRPAVSVGDKVKPGTVLADGPATKDGVLALGRNLLVAFLPWQGGELRRCHRYFRTGGAG